MQGKCAAAESADNAVGAAIAAVAGSFPSSKAETFANTQQIQQLTYANAQLNSSLSALELEVDGLKAQAKGATGANGQAGATGVRIMEALQTGCSLSQNPVKLVCCAAMIRHACVMGRGASSCIGTLEPCPGAEQH